MNSPTALPQTIVQIAQRRKKIGTCDFRNTLFTKWVIYEQHHSGLRIVWAKTIPEKQVEEGNPSCENKSEEIRVQKTGRKYKTGEQKMDDSLSHFVVFAKFVLHKRFQERFFAGSSVCAGPFLCPRTDCRLSPFVEMLRPRFLVV